MRGESTIFALLSGQEQPLDRVRRYGVAGQPIPATETYRKVLSSLLKDGIRVEKWIIINERDGTYTLAMTYNGAAGAHFDAARSTHALNWDLLRSRLEDYRFVAADECPLTRLVSRAAQFEHAAASYAYAQ